MEAITGLAELGRRIEACTQSTGTAGHHLLAIGFLLCKLALPPGARIVEFGPGWGNSTMELARLGLDVTAVDIEPSFCEVVRRRAVQLGVRVAVVEADFFWAEKVAAPYDAALFFECFHHCHDHLRLLRALHGAVRPGGSVFLASEPIIDGYAVPWGLRMDGEALWAIRNFGWLELGYDEEYFREALARTGWRGTRHECSTVPWASVWQLQRPGEGEVKEEVAPVAPAPGPVEEPVAVAADGVDPDGMEAALVAEQAGSERLARELAAVYRSTSWRVTRPLRGLRRVLGGQGG